MVNNKIPIVLIVGPTATAKTRIAKLVAQELPCVLINCDKFQVYRELNIGVNKSHFCQNEAHALFDIISLDQPYSISNFQKDARKVINTTLKAKKIPILVGGSILYALSVIKDYHYSLPRKMTSPYQNLNNQELFSKLEKVDPIEAKKIHLNNRKRVLRALEISAEQGKSKTVWNQQQNPNNYYANIITFNFVINQNILKKIIDQRIQEQIDAGLINEVKSLLQKFPKELDAFQAIGYKQVITGLETNTSLESIINHIETATRKLAKKQITFAKKLPNIITCAIDLNNLFLTKKMIIFEIKKKLKEN